MELKKLGVQEKGAPNQDGAVWGKELFRLNHLGECVVRDMDTLQPKASFLLDKVDIIVPHSNSVVFGCEYWQAGDEFPLLYANIYNNYAASEDPLVGVCCVYRLFRTECGFDTRLVQLIRIGFTDDRDLWRSCENDVRPYGNFVADREGKRLYAFVMRDAVQETRYFAFRMPAARDGVFDEKYGVPVVTLTPEDILEQFDTPYHMYIQGACCHKGKIYSAEGFGEWAPDIPAGIRIIDLKAKKQELYVNLDAAGYPPEPECIDFVGEKCVFADAEGNFYEAVF